MYGYGASPLELLACQAMVHGLAYLDEFKYSCSWVKGTSSALTAKGDKTQTIQINSDSDFIAQEYHLTAQSADYDQFGLLPNFLMMITRSGSGRDLMNQPVLVPNMCGNYCGWVGKELDDKHPLANFPGRLSISSLYQGNSLVSIRLQNPMPDWNPNLVQFTMSGFKVFYQTNAAGQTGNRQDIFHAL